MSWKVVEEISTFLTNYLAKWEVLGSRKVAHSAEKRFKKLKGEYKKIKDSNKPTGTDRKSGKFYDKLNEILGNKPATKPHVIVDTLADDKEAVVVDSSEDLSDQEEGHRNDANEQVTEKEDTTNKTSLTSSPTEVVGNKRKRQKKIDKGLKGDNVFKILGKVIELQEASDKMEEKRIKLDEELLRMEETRLKEMYEREEHRRKEDREFQIRILQILCGSQNQMSPPPYPYFNYYDPHRRSTSCTSTSTPTSSNSLYDMQFEENEI